ncbi:MAG: hypothetical protein R2712_31545 [Vicinamibacterales bacterium]
MVTLATLETDGLLAPSSPDPVAHPPRIDARNPDERAMLGLAGNWCVPQPRRRPGATRAALAARGTHRTRRGHRRGHGVTRTGRSGGSPVCRTAKRGWWTSTIPSRALLRRMRSRAPATQMPPLGTVVRDQDAIALVTRWLTDAARVALSVSGLGASVSS